MPGWSGGGAMMLQMQAEERRRADKRRRDLLKASLANAAETVEKREDAKRIERQEAALDYGRDIDWSDW